jgi:cytochrome P450
MKREISYDPRSPEVMEDPFPIYRRLREAAPVQYYEGLGAPYYIVFRYEDVQNASTNVEQYTAKYGSAPRIGEPAVMMNDGDIHLAFRHIIQARFLPRAMVSHSVKVQDIVRRLIDDMIAAGPPANMFEQFALPIPVKTTLALMGIGEERYHEMAELADQTLAAAWCTLTPEQEADLFVRIPATFEAMLREREQMLRDAGVTEPGRQHVGTVLPDDLISDVLTGKVEGRYLTRPEAYHLMNVLLVGGVDTTAHLISNLIWRLLEDRSRWEAVMADQEKMIPIAIEESLRFDPPGLGLWRTTARDVEVAGEILPGHSKVQMSYASANRDPSVFSDPETFRLDRPMAEMRKHLTFGAGAHLCVGQHLARLEATIALKELFARLPTLRLAGPTERTDNFGFWGRKRLPVAW